jgi:hypothetical protein
MSAVLAFAHRGVPCAIPAAQARAVDVRIAPEEQAKLWEGEACAHARAIEAEAGDGTIWVGCADPRLVELPEGAALGLSPLLRGILAALPHVVGLSVLNGSPTWLVDLARYRLESVAVRSRTASSDESVAVRERAAPLAPPRTTSER